MSENSETRFHSIMDKLFYKPRPKSSSSGAQFSRGQKRPHPTSLSIMESKSASDKTDKSIHTPICRPWDRGDLMRRLATFKSMTWFGKPKVVGAVNCARRGWVNVEMDIIACEACGARLLFSTPSSWTQHQVEKAASVFSLKLENGHKLLCPWIDNACAETLAQFPPMPAPELVSGYKERCSALLTLSALPVISSSAIDCMRSPQLEHFLKQSSMRDCGSGSTDTSQTEYLGNECEAVSSNLYYQAHKLISLCGWEPRLLPYVVDGKGHTDQTAKYAKHSSLSQNSNICVYSARANDIMGGNEDSSTFGEQQSNPNSVVLDCRLCGASVGLWAFSTVPQPVELFRLVGYSELNGEKDLDGIGGPDTHKSGDENHTDSREGVVNTTSTGATSSKDKAMQLNLTIAGGPPPTKKNFRAAISLPIIGQNLRARIFFDSDIRDRKLKNQENIASGSCDKSSFQELTDQIANTSTRQMVQSEDIELLKRKTHDEEHCTSTSDDQLPCSNNKTSEPSVLLGNENSNQMSLMGTHATFQGLNCPDSGTHDLSMGGQIEITPNVGQGSGQNDKLLGNEEDVGRVNPEVGHLGGSQVSNSCITPLGASVETRSGATSGNDLSLIVVADDCNLQQVLQSDIVCREVSIASHEGNAVKDSMQIPANNEGANDIPKDQVVGFDPIKQHRHFCPWIMSTGSAAPGWQQTLSALQREKEFDFSPSSPTDTDSSPVSSLIKVDDPINSVRKLFASSSSAKRMKPPTHNHKLPRLEY